MAAVTDWSAPAAYSFVRDVVRRCRRTGVGFLAAALSYYALVSVVPLAALATLALATVAGDVVADRVVAVAGDALSVSGREMVRRVLTTAAGRAQATGLGVVVLLWGATRLFRGLDHAFARVYDRVDGDGLLGHVGDSIGALAAVLAAVLVATGLLWAGLVAPEPITRAVGVESIALGSTLTVLLDALRVGLVVALLFPAFYVLPDVEMTLRRALPGAIISGVGWTALFVGFRRYVAGTDSGALSGVLGGIVLVLSGFYAASLFVLVGAAVNAELGHEER